jgi:ankyrin repeat protein
MIVDDDAALVDACANHRRPLWMVDYFLDRGASVDGIGELDPPLVAALFQPGKVHRLLERGADPNKPNTRGELPIFGAVAATPVWGNKSLELLIKYGARLEDQNLLRWAAGQSCPPETLQILIDAGANCSEKGSDGKTPLQAAIASVSGVEGKIDVLLKNGADVQTGDLLHEAARSPWSLPPTLSKLLDAGLSVDALDEQNKTALHYAAARGNMEKVTVLLERGANPTIGESSFLAAVRSGRQDVAKAISIARNKAK